MVNLAKLYNALFITDIMPKYAYIIIKYQMCACMLSVHSTPEFK
jgi:hypothetical protein